MMVTVAWYWLVGGGVALVVLAVWITVTVAKWSWGEKLAESASMVTHWKDRSLELMRKHNDLHRHFMEVCDAREKLRLEVSELRTQLRFAQGEPRPGEPSCGGRPEEVEQIRSEGPAVGKDAEAVADEMKEREAKALEAAADSHDGIALWQELPQSAPEEKVG